MFKGVFRSSSYDSSQEKLAAHNFNSAKQGPARLSHNVEFTGHMNSLQPQMLPNIPSTPWNIEPAQIAHDNYDQDALFTSADKCKTELLTSRDLLLNTFRLETEKTYHLSCDINVQQNRHTDNIAAVREASKSFAVPSTKSQDHSNMHDAASKYMMEQRAHSRPCNEQPFLFTGNNDTSWNAPDSNSTPWSGTGQSSHSGPLKLNNNCGVVNNIEKKRMLGACDSFSEKTDYFSINNTLPSEGRMNDYESVDDYETYMLKKRKRTGHNISWDENEPNENDTRAKFNYKDEKIPRKALDLDIEQSREFDYTVSSWSSGNILEPRSSEARSINMRHSSEHVPRYNNSTGLYSRNANSTETSNSSSWEASESSWNFQHTEPSSWNLLDEKNTQNETWGWVDMHSDNTNSQPPIEQIQPDPPFLNDSTMQIPDNEQEVETDVHSRTANTSWDNGASGFPPTLASDYFAPTHDSMDSWTESNNMFTSHSSTLPPPTVNIFKDALVDPKYADFLEKISNQFTSQLAKIIETGSDVFIKLHDDPQIESLAFEGLLKMIELQSLSPHHTDPFYSRLHLLYLINEILATQSDLFGSVAAFKFSENHKVIIKAMRIIVQIAFDQASANPSFRLLIVEERRYFDPLFMDSLLELDVDHFKEDLIQQKQVSLLVPLKDIPVLQDNLFD